MSAIVLLTCRLNGECDLHVVRSGQKAFPRRRAGGDPFVLTALRQEAKSESWVAAILGPACEVLPRGRLLRAHSTHIFLFLRRAPGDQAPLDMSRS